MRMDRHQQGGTKRLSRRTGRGSQLTFEELLVLHDELDERLASGLLSRREYQEEWEEYVSSAGWTQEQFEDMIDDRWMSNGPSFYDTKLPPSSLS